MMSQSVSTAYRACEEPVPVIKTPSPDLVSGLTLVHIYSVAIKASRQQWLAPQAVIECFADGWTYGHQTLLDAPPSLQHVHHRVSLFWLYSATLQCFRRVDVIGACDLEMALGYKSLRVSVS